MIGRHVLEDLIEIGGADGCAVQSREALEAGDDGVLMYRKPLAANATEARR